jgi:molybdopterin-guanine dinucleotide biosynthesis protein A
MNSFTSAALLAAGKSLRMGFDKQFLHVRRDQLFAEILPKLTNRFEDVTVVTRQPKIYRSISVRAIDEIVPGLGPLSAIHAAISEAVSEYVYIIACDMPRIDLNYIDYMIQKIIANSPADACVAKKGEEIEPFHAFYSKQALPAIEAALYAGEKSVCELLQKINTLFIPETETRRFSPDWSLFYNLNTLEEYNKMSVSGSMTMSEEIA